MNSIQCPNEKLITEIRRKTHEIARKSRHHRCASLMSGSISVTNNAERFEELKRGASMVKVFGLEVEVILPQEAAAIWPLTNQ